MPRVPSDPERPVDDRRAGQPQDVVGACGLGPYILVLTAAGAALWVLRVWPPTAGEPLVLRWARVASDHPGRTGLALVLLVFALRPRRSRS